MKTKLLLSALLSFYFYLLSSQVPQGFNYQAIARDGSGNPITGATMQVKIAILSDTISNTIVWEELFNPVKTNAFGLFTIVVGTGARLSGVPSFSAIDWTKTPLFIRTSIYYPAVWKIMGTSKLQSVPYSMVAGNLEGTVPLLSVKGNTTAMDSALFVVRNNTGQIIFAVYNEGVRIYVDDGKTKGSTKGGFAIGGFGTSKGSSQPLFVVDPDSIRAYIDNNPSKTAKGGFAIGGFDKSKSPVQDLLNVSHDSIRMYINDNLAKGSVKGGFAIGGFSSAKGGNSNFFNVATDTAGIINPAVNRILWYPLKNAFLTGNIIIEDKDSVGVNSFSTGYKSRAKGSYSQAMGYQSISRGAFSTAIGKSAFSNASNSFSLGDSPKATGNDSYAFGAGAIASGNGSFSFGSIGRDTTGNTTGITTASGNYSFALGQGSQTIGIGSVGLGLNNQTNSDYSSAIGFQNTTSGKLSAAIGTFNTATQPYSTAIGVSSYAAGQGSTALGYNAITYGPNSVAIGTPTGSGSIIYAQAYYAATIAYGNGSIALGHGVTAYPYASMSIGQQNDVPAGYSTSSWVSTDPLFVIGNGNGGGYGAPHTHNALVVLKNGNMGLGTNTPAYLIDVNGEITSRNSASGLSFRLRNSSYSTMLYHDNNDFYMLITNYLDPDGIWNSYRPLRIQYTTGNVYLGSGNSGTSYSFTAQSDGNIYMPSLATQSGSAPIVVLTVNSSGKLIKYTITSSIRFKQDIVDMEDIEWVYKLHPVNYSYKSDPLHHKEYGLIAEEVEKINPSIVAYDEKGEVISVNYPSIISPLIKGLQEHNYQIRQLIDENRKLRSINSELQSRLDALESRLNKIEDNMSK